MKFRITLILALMMMSSICLAQRRSINYKAVVKDANGNLVVNQQIAVLLTIEQGTALTNVYRESHTPTTDSNGMMVFNLGEGTVVNGDYNTIDWAADDHFLNTKINTGSGIVDLGTVEFKTVPYALQARSATMSTTNNVTSNAPGDIATDDFVFGSIQLDNDSGIDDNNRLFFDKSKGAFRAGKGNYGYWNENELGSFSIAFGDNPAARGYSSAALGQQTEANGDFSLATGGYSEASGDYAIAFGHDTKATGKFSMAGGEDSEASGEYGIALGDSNAASGKSSIALGYNSEASAMYAIAIGYSSEAEGDYSTTMGFETIALGDYSVALGNDVAATGNSALASGFQTEANGMYSASSGYRTVAFSYNSTAIGRYNKKRGSMVIWEPLDPLFEIGNGSSYENRNNAFTVLKNGNVGIDTYRPAVKLQITNGEDANLNDGSGFFVLGEENSINLVMDSNEIMARDNNVGAPLYLQKDGGGAVWVGGSVVHSSDKRLKRDIKDIGYGLEEVLSLNPVSYYWKDREQEHPSLGLIAQEVQPILKNVVNIADDKDKTLSVSYTELIPVLIKAIQEQQETIETLKSEVANLKPDQNRVIKTEKTK